MGFNISYRLEGTKGRDRVSVLTGVLVSVPTLACENGREERA